MPTKDGPDHQALGLNVVGGTGASDKPQRGHFSKMHKLEEISMRNAAPRQHITN